jgi:phosphoribosylformylglycinamidine (FGAM) synthase-like enzyme
MWEFQQAIAGIRDACLALGTPVISGNVSFYNETEGRNIPPTPTIAMVGLPRRRRALPHAVVEGRGRRDRASSAERARRSAASEYLAVIHGQTRGTPPWIDLEAEKRLHRLILAAVQERPPALGARRRGGRARGRARGVLVRRFASRRAGRARRRMRTDALSSARASHG